MRRVRRARRTTLPEEGGCLATNAAEKGPDHESQRALPQPEWRPLVSRARSGCGARVCQTPSQYALRRAYCRDRDRSIPQSRKWSGTPGIASAHRHTAKRRKASNRDGQNQRSQKEVRVPHHKVSAPPDGFQHSIDRRSSHEKRWRPSPKSGSIARYDSTRVPTSSTNTVQGCHPGSTRRRAAPTSAACHHSARLSLRTQRCRR